MPQSLPSYHFITQWRLKGRAEDAYDLISKPDEYRRWWHGPVYQVTPIAPGDSGGVGRIDGFYLKGKLPYGLRWQLCCTEAKPFEKISAEAQGDLVGRGIWTFEQIREEVKVIFDWKVQAANPILRFGTFFLRPFFAWNHNWVMSAWGKSLKEELLRRQSVIPKN